MIYVPGRPATPDQIPRGARDWARRVGSVEGWEVWAIVYSMWRGQARRKQADGTMPLRIVIGETITVRVRNVGLREAGYQGWDRLDEGDWTSTGGVMRANGYVLLGSKHMEDWVRARGLVTAGQE